MKLWNQCLNYNTTYKNRVINKYNQNETTKSEQNMLNETLDKIITGKDGQEQGKRARSYHNSNAQLLIILPSTRSQK